MLIIPLLVAGSIAYASVKVLAPAGGGWWRPLAQGSAKTAVTVSVVPADRSSSSGATGPKPGAQAGMKPDAARRYHTAATAALGLAAGSLVFPVLSLASVPLTLYSSLPILEAGCRAIAVERKFKPSVAASLLIVGTLLTRHDLAAASLSWLSHTSWRIKENAGRVAADTWTDVSNRILQVTGNPPLTVWKVCDSVEVQTPFAQLAAGDVIVVSRGEVIPLDGVVTGGTATVNLFFRTGVAASLSVGEGDPVYVRSVVTSGRIFVRIEQDPC